jgi:hypothetical protein
MLLAYQELDVTFSFPQDYGLSLSTQRHITKDNNFNSITVDTRNSVSFLFPFC